MIPLSVSTGQNMTREIFLDLRNFGFAFDDDNEPVPENIPVDTTVDTFSDIVIDRNVIATDDWGFDAVDQWRTSGSGVFLPPNRIQNILHPFHVCPFFNFPFSSTHMITSNSFSSPRRISTFPTGIWNSLSS